MGAKEIAEWLSEWGECDIISAIAVDMLATVPPSILDLIQMLQKRVDYMDKELGRLASENKEFKECQKKQS